MEFFLYNRVNWQNFRGAVDSFRVNTVDTTGAGDSFVGALLCKIVENQSIIEVKYVFFLDISSYFT